MEIVKKFITLAVSVIIVISLVVVGIEYFFFALPENERLKGEVYVMANDYKNLDSAFVDAVTVLDEQGLIEKQAEDSSKYYVPFNIQPTKSHRKVVDFWNYKHKAVD